LQPGGADQIVATSSVDNYCFPTAMNILGQSVGYNVSLYFNTFYDDFFYDGGIAALYTGGQSISLGSLHPAAFAGGVPASSAARGVNNLGIIVGLSETSDSPENATAGFIYLNGTMYNLNDLVNTTASGLTITEAQGINDLGQIVATAIDASGSEHAVILTPQFQ
jgi:probable HAF family extracellular repeat protein